MRISIIAIYVALLPALVLADGPAPSPQSDLEAQSVQLNLAAKRQQEQMAEVMRNAQEAEAKARSASLSADKLYLHIDSDQLQNVPIRYRGVAGWWNAVDRYSQLTTDATNMAVAAVLQASELLKPRGAEAQIQYFEQLLPQVKNETVRRAIRLQLIDAYKQANNPERALDELQTLITSAPKGK
jgi:hypothetical protein